jgi:hypothetical protein
MKPSMQAVGSLFFSLGVGWLLHNVLTLIFLILTEDKQLHAS